MFKGLESELLKSDSLQQCSQSWNGSCEKCLDTLELCYKLFAMGAPDWRAIFEDWADVGAIRSVQNFLFLGRKHLRIRRILTKAL